MILFNRMFKIIFVQNIKRHSDIVGNVADLIHQIKRLNVSFVGSKGIDKIVVESTKDK